MKKLTCLAALVLLAGCGGTKEPARSYDTGTQPAPQAESPQQQAYSAPQPAYDARQTAYADNDDGTVRLKAVSWDRARTIDQAALELAHLHKEMGAGGLFQHIADCHNEHMARSPAYTQEVEFCLIQNVLLSRSTVMLHETGSPEAAALSGGQSPAAINTIMMARLDDTADKYGRRREEIYEIARIAYEMGAPRLPWYPQEP